MIETNDYIYFFTRDKKSYFKYRNTIYDLNTNNIIYLKETLNMPCKLEFVGYTRQNMNNVVSLLIEDNIEMKYRKIGSEFTLHYIFLLKNKVKKHAK